MLLFSAKHNGVRFGNGTAAAMNACLCAVPLRTLLCRWSSSRKARGAYEVREWLPSSFLLWPQSCNLPKLPGDLKIRIRRSPANTLLHVPAVFRTPFAKFLAHLKCGTLATKARAGSLALDNAESLLGVLPGIFRAASLEVLQRHARRAIRHRAGT